MTNDPGVDEQHVFVDQIHPVQFHRKFAASEEHAFWRRARQLLNTSAQGASDVVAVGPLDVCSRL